MKTQVPLREIKKERTKEALEKAALRLFEEKGYANTSVAAIAAEANVSRRTFFRYFRSKEGVVFANADDAGRALQNAIAEQPAHKTPMEAFGDAATSIIRYETSDPARTEQILARQRLFLENVELRSRLTEIARVWRPYQAEALAKREGRSTPDEADLLYAAVGVSLVQTVLDEWASDGGKDDLAGRFERAFGLFA
ncbi:MAG: TetR/AcrR family transcriptional regulator [Actinomycetota bacterium]